MPIRMKLKELFSIPRSEGTFVENNRVISDGHNHKDLAYINVDNMQKYLNTDVKDFWQLYSMTLEKVYSEVNAAQEEQIRNLDEEKAKRSEERLVALEALSNQMGSLMKEEKLEAEVEVKRRGRKPKSETTA